MSLHEIIEPSANITFNPSAEMIQPVSPKNQSCHNWCSKDMTIKGNLNIKTTDVSMKVCYGFRAADDLYF